MLKGEEFHLWNNFEDRYCGIIKREDIQYLRLGGVYTICEIEQDERN